MTSVNGMAGSRVSVWRHGRGLSKWRASFNAIIDLFVMLMILSSLRTGHPVPSDREQVSVGMEERFEQEICAALAAHDVPALSGCLLARITRWPDHQNPLMSIPLVNGLGGTDCLDHVHQ
jgi:hypothetical protein